MNVDETALRRALRSRDHDQVLRLLEPVAARVGARYYADGLEHQDLVQAARIGIHSGIDTWSGRGSFTSWAWFCADRSAITALKTAHRGYHRPVNESRSLHGPAAPHLPEGPELGEVLPGAPDPLEQLLGDQLMADLRRAIAEDLTPLERDSLLSTAHGHSYHDVALRLGVPAKTIDNASQRAVRKLAHIREEHVRA